MTIVAYIEGRLGRYTVTIAGGPSGGDVTLELATVPVITYGRLDVAFGPLLLPSYTTLEFIDPYGVIRAAFFDFEETDYLVTIEGPGILWKGRPRKGSRPRPVASRVRGEVHTLDVYDRLGGLSEVVGEAVVDVPVPFAPLSVGELIVRNLQEALPLDVYLYNDLWPINIDASTPGETDRDLRNVRFSAEPAGDVESGDATARYGTLKEQLEAGASSLGVRVFQSASDATWRVVHRAAIGEAVAVQHVAANGTWSRVELPVDVAALSEAEVQALDEDVIDAIARLGRVNIEMQDGYNLVLDGGFDYWEGGAPVYWEHEGDVSQVTGQHPTEENAVQLLVSGAFESASVAQDVVSVASAEAQPGTYPRLRFDYYLTGAVTLVCELVLRGDDEMLYWDDQDGEWQAAPAGVLQPSTPDVWHEVVIIPDAPPVQGTLRVEFHAAEDGAVWLSAVRLDFVDANAAVVDTVFLSQASGSQGRQETIRALPALHTNTNGAGAWMPAAGWESVRYGSAGGRAYSHLFMGRADDLLQQQGRDVPVLVATVWGLHGPQRRLVGDLDGDGETEHLIAEGLQLRLEDGTTRGVWPALPAGVVNPPSGSGSGS